MSLRLSSTMAFCASHTSVRALHALVTLPSLMLSIVWLGLSMSMPPMLLPPPRDCANWYR